MIIMGILNTLEKPAGNFIEILLGEVEEKGLDVPNNKLTWQ